MFQLRKMFMGERKLIYSIFKILQIIEKLLYFTFLNFKTNLFYNDLCDFRGNM